MTWKTKTGCPPYFFWMEQARRWDHVKTPTETRAANNAEETDNGEETEARVQQERVRAD